MNSVRVPLRSPFAWNLLVRKYLWNSLSLLGALVLGVSLFAATSFGQIPRKKNVLIVTDTGVSHVLSNLLIKEIVTGVQEVPGRHVEFYTEDLGVMAAAGGPSWQEEREWLAAKYGGLHLDAVVAIGPDAVNFLSSTDTLFSQIPIVICGTSVEQLANPKLDSRFTGSWVKLEPAKTLEVALRLFPETRHVYVVSGSSTFDRVAASVTRKALDGFRTDAEIVYLQGMDLDKLLKFVAELPDHSIFLYTSFFQDSAGNKFLNATKALPLISSASNGPDFGMSDTYLGHGIVGGYLMTFEKQGKVTANMVSALLDGKDVRELPMETLPGAYMFDWQELERWHISEKNLPPGSVIMFREPGYWGRTRWMWITTLLIILGLSCLVVYQQYNRTVLQHAKTRLSQLSGMLIDAEERERSRVAFELHDDFSQRLALLSLGMENAAENIPNDPKEAGRQLHDLLNSASELGADMHTLSHLLHSSTLERLGLIPGVSAFCKEFQAQQHVQVEFLHNEIPPDLPKDASLCVFRVIQEALRNVKKHSGANTAHVEVYVNDGKLTAIISDEGLGFDIRKVEKRDGLGLVSIEERVHRLSGYLKIQSTPGKGTRLEVCLPLEPRAGSES